MKALSGGPQSKKRVWGLQGGWPTSRTSEGPREARNTDKIRAVQDSTSGQSRCVRAGSGGLDGCGPAGETPALLNLGGQRETCLERLALKVIPQEQKQSV